MEPALHPQTAASPSPKVWTAGTLTYTSAGLVTLFLWLLWGDFAWQMRDRSVGPLAGWYLNHLKVPNVLFALLFSSLPSLISLFLGPVISVKSDRHRGKLGRRIPFLLITTPIAALGMIGLALTPLLAKWAHQFCSSHLSSFAALLQNEMAVSVICFGIFWVVFECASIAGQSVFNGLINDVVPTPLLGRFYGLFRAVSLIDGMIFNFWIMGKAPSHFTLILTLVGLFYGTAFLWVCFKVKEGSYPPVQLPASGSKKGGFFSSAKSYCRECFTNPYYITLFLMLMTAGIAFGPVNTFSIPYARSLGISMETYGKSLALTYAISLCLSFFMGWMADLFHPLRVAMATLAGYVLVTVWGSFYATTPNAYLAAWVLHGVLSGCYFSGAASLGQRLFPRSKFAQFASAASIFGALANMVIAPLLGVLIDQSGNHLFHHTFTVAAILSLTALAIAWYVYQQFMKLGGPKAYMAPE
ncbi:MAG: MFS transporter [Chthoniobacteraceae bacterium]